MTVEQWGLRFFFVSVIICIFLYLGKRVFSIQFFILSPLIVHILVLGSFLSGILATIDISYLTFDVIWWSALVMGVIGCICAIKTKSKLIYLLFPTTSIFLILFIPMLAMNSM